MKESMKESSIESVLVSETKRARGWSIKLNSLAGLPDRLVLLPGRVVFFVELKKKGKKPRPIQKAVIRKIENIGFRVYVLDNSDDVRNVIRAYAIT